MPRQLHQRDHAVTAMHGHWTKSNPVERGAAYVATMRDIAEDQDDLVLQAHHLAELDRIVRPFNQMTPEGLHAVLEGIHDALLDLFNELIVHPRHPAKVDQTNDPLGIVVDQCTGARSTAAHPTALPSDRLSRDQEHIPLLRPDLSVP